MCEINKIRSAIIEMREEQLMMYDFLPDIINKSSDKNEISNYWTEHTVHDDWFISREESLSYCEERFRLYPYFREMAEMDRKHDGEIILDYGCGPGNDLVWYSWKNNLKEIIGIDVSISALKNAQFRMGLLKKPKETVKLYCIDDNLEMLPLEEKSVDFINCMGVLMHTSNPEKILKDFYRIVRPNNKNSCVCVMVYNKDSIWYHLYASYYLKYINCSALKPLTQNTVKNMPVEEIFKMSTDGVNCPKAVCYTSDEFIEICKRAGFRRVEYRGGYPNNLEPSMAKEYISIAVKDERLEKVHKDFLEKVVFDKDGYPMFENQLCCIGGVYHLWK